MRAFHKLVALFLVGATIGLVSCSQEEDAIINTSSDDERTTITIDKQKLREKTDEAVDSAKEAGRRALDETGEALEDAGRALREAGDDEVAPPES
jgi:hypothetical protein